MNSLKPLFFVSSLIGLLLLVNNSRTEAQDAAKSADPPVTAEKSDTLQDDTAADEKSDTRAG